MSTASSAIIAGVIAALTVGAGGLISYRREAFERERIRRLDEERLDRERSAFNAQLIASRFAQPVQQSPPIAPMTNPQIIPMYVNNNGVAQMDVNWNNNPVPVQHQMVQQPLYCDSPVHQNTNYINPNMEFTFGDNDAIMRQISSRPPMASPIFGIHY